MNPRMLTFGPTALVLVSASPITVSRNGLNQAGVKTDFIRLETAGITGNSHMMMLEKNSDDIIKFIVSWIQKNATT